MAERKQVNLNLGKVSATPSIQAVGGTNQAVVPGVLKDNSAMRLSRSLAQFSNILGQTSNINMQRGKDAAEKLSSQEINDIIEGKIPAPTGGALGKLGFQKAFHQIAAKRWFDTTGVQKYAELESNLETKLDEFIRNSTPIEQVQSYVQEQVNSLDQEIGQYFEGNAFGSRVKNLLGSELSTRVLTGATKGYEKKQLEYMKAAKFEQYNKEFANAVLGISDEGISDFVKRAETEMRDFADNKEIAAFYKENLNKVMGILVANSQVEGDTALAEAQIEVIEGIKGKNGIPIASSLENRLTLATAKSRLKRIDTDEVTMERVELKDNFVGAMTSVYNTFKRYTDRGEKIVKGTTPYMALENALDVLNIDGDLGSDEEMAAIVERIASSEEETPQEALGSYLTQIVNERKDNPDIRISSLIRSTQDDLITRRIEINKAAQSVDLGYSRQAIQDANENALQYFLQNSEMSVDDYLDTTDLPDNTKPTKIIQRAYNEVHKFDEALPKEEDIENILKAAYDPLVKNKKFKSLFGSSGTAGSKVDPLISSQLLKNQAKEQASFIRKALLETARQEFSAGDGLIKEGTAESLQQIMRQKAANVAKIYEMELEAQAIRLDQFEEVKDLDDKIKIREFSPKERAAIIKDTRAGFIAKDIDDTKLYFNPAEGNLGEWFFNWGDKNPELAEYKSLGRDFVKSVIGDEFTPNQQIDARIQKQRDKIDEDYSKAREKAEEDTTPLRLLQDIYGYETIDFNSQKILDDLDATERDWTDVKLFSSPQNLREAAQTFLDLFNKIEATEGAIDLTQDDQKVLDYAVRLGIFSDQQGNTFPFLSEFIKAQTQFLPDINN